MATRLIDDRNKIAGRTEFQLHISQFQSYHASKDRLLDFSEKRLEWYLKNVVTDPAREYLINELLKDYVAGRIAIAWKSGEPVYVKMNRTT